MPACRASVSTRPGTLADGAPDFVTTPSPSLAGAGVSLGGGHACTVGYSTLCWGRDDAGQLGFGQSPAPGLPPQTWSPSFQSPLPFEQLDPAVEVSSGDRHSCARMPAGTVYCWGLNASGQLGVGNTAPLATPTPVIGLTGVTKIVAGDDHTSRAQVRHHRLVLGTQRQGPAWQRVDPELVGPRAGHGSPRGDEHRRGRRPHVCDPDGCEGLVLGRQRPWAARDQQLRVVLRSGVSRCVWAVRRPGQARRGWRSHLPRHDGWSGLLHRRQHVGSARRRVVRWPVDRLQLRTPWAAACPPPTWRPAELTRALRRTPGASCAGGRTVEGSSARAPRFPPRTRSRWRSPGSRHSMPMRTRPARPRPRPRRSAGETTRGGSSNSSVSTRPRSPSSGDSPDPTSAVDAIDLPVPLLAVGRHRQIPASAGRPRTRRSARRGAGTHGTSSTRSPVACCRRSRRHTAANRTSRPAHAGCRHGPPGGGPADVIVS